LSPRADSENVTAVILQPSYLPWKGYFDQISRAEIFVFFDDVQFTKKSWRSRNKLLGAQGEFWLSVPVERVDRQTLIKDVSIDSGLSWQRKHFEAIRNTYARAQYSEEVIEIASNIFLGKTWRSLLDLNVYSTQAIANYLGLSPSWYFSSSLDTAGSRDGSRALEIMEQLGATHLLNGPRARDYVDSSLFSSQGVALSYMVYDYPSYSRKSELFSHEVSILDVIAHCGEDSGFFIRSQVEPIKATMN